MGGKGRAQAKMKIMAKLGENLYRTTKVFGPMWEKQKWQRFRTVERDNIIAWQKWREAEKRLQRDEAARLKIGAVAAGGGEGSTAGAAPESDGA
mmetsp:Transcript_20128/g.61341  ORF Transcript_20128/g.61341 Transcript_20128/m.61341 type:complete len:94 (-) Transcript_20128:83-364(-)